MNIKPVDKVTYVSKKYFVIYRRQNKQKYKFFKREHYEQ